MAFDEGLTQRVREILAAWLNRGLAFTQTLPAK